MQFVDREIYANWPDPFPMLFDSFAEYSYDPIPAMYIPCKLAILEKMMYSTFRTTRNRGPNTNNNTASKTGGGKDSNTVEPMVAIVEDLIAEVGSGQIDRTHIKHLLASFTPFNNSATGITQWLKPIKEEHDAGNGVTLIDPEGESHFRNVGQTSSGGAGQAAREIVDAEIAAFNGQRIRGRTTKDTSIEEIADPNISIHRLVQTDILHECVNPWMISKGYVPRLNIWYDNENREERPSTLNNKHYPNPHPDYIPFLAYAGNWFYGKSEGKPKITVVSGQEGNAISEYEVNTIFKDLKRKLDNDEFRSVKRVIMVGEKLVTTISAWVWCWNDYLHEVKGADKYQSPIEDIELENSTFKGIYGHQYEECIIPMLHMLTENKMNLIHASHDTVEHHISEFIFECYERSKNAKSQMHEAHLKKGLIPRALLNKKCKEHKELKIVVNTLGEKWDDKLDKWLFKRGFDVRVLKGDDGTEKECIIPRKEAKVIDGADRFKK